MARNGEARHKKKDITKKNDDNCFLLYHCFHFSYLFLDNGLFFGYQLL